MATAHGAGDSVELVRELDRLEDITTEWRRLAIERGNAFVTPEWFGAWWAHYGAAHEPLVCVVRDAGGAVRGLVPLALSTGGRARTARFAGSSLGDHFHPVAGAADDAAVAASVGRALRSEPRRGPTLVLENVDAEATWWRELSREGGAPEPVVDRRTALLGTSLAGRSWEEVLADRSRNLRSQLGRRRRALERDGDVRVRWTQDGEVPADMATLFRLHDARWQARAGASSLTSERARAFHVDFAVAAQRQGWLRLCFLELEGAPVAAWYGWRLGERYAYYQAGFDPAWADRSVGLVLFAETIRAAAEEGAAEYDMLLGEEAFKARFADFERQVCTSVIAPRLRPSRLAALAEARLRRVGARLPERVRDPAKHAARSVLDRLPMARRR